MDILTVTGSVKGKMEAPAAFNVEGQPGLVWDSVTCYLANQRQGNACTKTRAEVSGTGKKPYRQKHTGNARHGSRRSPIFRGGGIVFGPKPRDYSYDLTKKMRRRALLLALSAKNKAERVVILEDFEVAQPKTKEIAKIIADCRLDGKTLLLVDNPGENLKRASRNIPGLTVAPAAQVSAYAVVSSDRVVFTQAGLSKFLDAMGVK